MLSFIENIISGMFFHFCRSNEIPWQGRDLVDVARRTFQPRVVLGLFPGKMFSSLGEVQYSVMRACQIFKASWCQH